MHDDQPEPRTAATFAACWAQVDAVMDLTRRLPELPFRSGGGDIRITDYDDLLAADFIPVLTGLMDDYGDHAAALVAVDPTPEYYAQHYGHYPAVRLERDNLAERYWDAIAYEPAGDPTGAIAYTGDVVAVAGTTGQWAVWGQRDWSLVLVQTTGAAGAWQTSIPWVTAETALENFTYGYCDKTLDEPEAVRFVQNLRPYRVISG